VLLGSDRCCQVVCVFSGSFVCWQALLCVVRYSELSGSVCWQVVLCVVR